MVYSFVAILPLAGSAGRQYQTNSLGGNSSLSDSSGHGLGLVADYGSDQYASSSAIDFGNIRGWVRVHDCSSRKCRLTKHERHVLHMEHELHVRGVEPQPVQPVQPPSHGIWNCHQLEGLWDREGGNKNAQFIAAEIATAESGGNQNAISPTDDFGLWQINGSHGAEATLDPVGNARAAIAISSDGTNWTAWTTFNTGAYIGRC